MKWGFSFHVQRLYFLGAIDEEGDLTDIGAMHRLKLWTIPLAATLSGFVDLSTDKVGDHESSRWICFLLVLLWVFYRG